MNKPDDQILFAFFIHNKDQMYLIKQDGAFGSYYFPLGMPPDKKVFWRANYELKRTHWKMLNTEDERCDESDSEANTTQSLCIFECWEGNSEIRIYHTFFHRLDIDLP